MPSVSEFFNNVDYTQIIKNFNQKSPNGHLITILDCCFAFGLIDNYNNTADFHSVFAAADSKTETYYSGSEDIFFSLFSNEWDDSTFQEMQQNILSNALDQDSTCVIQIANKFLNSNFNPL